MSYQLPDELAALSHSGVGLKFSLVSGTIIEKNFLKSAQDFDESSSTKPLFTPEPEFKEIAEQVWLEELGGEKKEVCIFISNADTMFNIGEQITIVSMEGQNFPMQPVLIYNHATDHNFYLWDVDDVMDTVNPFNRDRKLERIWSWVGLASFATLLLGLWFVSYNESLVLYQFLGVIVAYYIFNKLPFMNSTIRKFSAVIAIQIIGFILSRGSVEMYGSIPILDAILTYGGIPSIAAIYMIHRTMIQKVEDKFHRNLLTHLCKIADFADIADGEERLLKSPPQAASFKK